MTLRVLIVDDSALIRNVLSDIINGASDMCVAGTARDALEAREQVHKLHPDVLTLDVEMPGMDGLEFLGRLMRAHPLPVVMVSASTERGSETTMRALELGAVDVMPKPRGSPLALRDYAELLRDKLRAAAGARVKPRLASSLDTAAASPPLKKLATPMGDLGAHFRVIAVGASTGGTEAIREFLSRMPANAPPILVTQHMPEAFTKAFAARLNAASAMTVSEAVQGEQALPGHAYIAPGHSHLLLARDGRGLCVALSSAPPVNRHRPAVDVLFHATAEVAGAQAIGVILTGMGKDGALGMLAMRQAGAYNFAQDEASCVVFGMPREAIACGATHEVVAVRDLASRVVERLLVGHRGLRAAS